MPRVESVRLATLSWSVRVASPESHFTQGSVECAACGGEIASGDSHRGGEVLTVWELLALVDAHTDRCTRGGAASGGW